MFLFLVISMIKHKPRRPMLFLSGSGSRWAEQINVFSQLVRIQVDIADFPEDCGQQLVLLLSMTDMMRRTAVEDH